jgi:general stress protein CsbA
MLPEMRNYTYFEHIIAVAVVGLLFGWLILEAASWYAASGIS